MAERVRFWFSRGFDVSAGWRQVAPRALVWQRGDEVVCERSGGVQRGADLLATLGAALADAGGDALAIGFVSYEFGALLDPLITVPAGDRPLPDAWWAVLSSGTQARSDKTHAQTFAAAGAVDVSLDDDAFCAGVGRIRAHIGAGDCYQVNLTRRWSVPSTGSPRSLFTALCGKQPPRHAAYLQDVEQGWAVLCLSPELLLRRRGDAVETRPIKGTRPRGRGAGAATELARSEKDVAELAMIVDLERNDLNRVCRAHTVRVACAGAPVRTRDVVHREARVVGNLADGVGWRDILTAILPGGSVTGAPKLAACAAIAALEPVPRSVYCGALGAFRANGDGTLALPIRTGYVVDGTLHFHSGCGVVWDSQEQAEEAESRAKVRSWFAALEV